MKSNKTLHEVCDAFGVTRRAVQGYEKAGLVHATGKNKYGYLLYDEEAQQRIAKIRLYQDMGFTIREIAELIDAPCGLVREALQKQLSNLKEEQKKINGLIEKICKMIKNI